MAIGGNRAIQTAQSFFNNIRKAGIVLSKKECYALHELIVELKSLGWEKFLVIYPFAGRDASSHSLNLVDAGKNIVNWVGSVIHDENGVRGNGTNAYGNTGLNATLLSPTSRHLSVYVSSDDISVTNPRYEIGANSATSNTVDGITARHSDGGNSRYFANDSGNSADIDFTKGLIVGVKNGTTSILTNQNKETNSYGPVAGSSQPNANYLLLARSIGTGVERYSSNRICFASIGDYLTQDETNTLIDIVTNYLYNYLDQDAVAYGKRIGITDINTLSKISNLFRTIKESCDWSDVRGYLFYKGMQKTDGTIIPFGGWSSNVLASAVGSPVLTNSGINLNGSSQYVVDDSDIWGGATNFTILSDIAQAGVSGTQGISTVYSNAIGNQAWALFASAATNYQFGSSSTGAPPVSFKAFGTPSLGSQRTVGTIFGPNSAVGFINGVQQSGSTPAASSIYNASIPITIGAFEGGGSPAGFFNGSIACVVLIKNSITTSQYQAINAAIESLRHEYEAEAEAFFAAAGITNVIEKDAINDLVIDLKKEGLWSKFYALYPFVGGTASSHSYNLINPSTFQITWNGTVTHNSNGITGDGSTGYGNTGYNPVSQGASSTNFALSVYTRGPTAANGTTRVDLGIQNREFQTTFIGWGNTGSWAAGAIAALPDASMYVPNANTTQREGLNSVIVNGSDVQAYYNQGVSLGTRSRADTGHPNFNFNILAQNNMGTAYLFSLKNIALAAIGEGRSPSEELAFSTIVQKFQTALGRAV